VNFLGAVLADPGIVKAYVPDTQMIDDMGADFFSFAEFYSHHVAPGDLPAAIVKGLARPTFATRIGGSTTVIDGYLPKQEGKR
jgi:poly(beta-D-mannuronate) lyase